ncbi:hypothetical protein FHS89_000418 [Rubricella aquisinus]|uniref:Uncharacterized protein n=1 Tax=Rubricella aquisinus TaxID=2028108 RepID=A0A840WT94_9RHOB|nr:hypothetical protein [Rubricella aquisinus]MBB5514420.1 hypothetical protein [Rubricella aquisinus]
MITLWTDGKPVTRRRCTLPPQTLLEGWGDRDARFYSESLLLALGLIVFNLIALMSGVHSGGFGMLVLTFGLPALGIAIAAYLLPPRHFLITTEGVETDKGRMSFRDLDRIDVFLTTLTLHGRSGYTLTVPYVRAPALLREVIFKAQEAAPRRIR